MVQMKLSIAVVLAAAAIAPVVAHPVPERHYGSGEMEGRRGGYRNREHREHREREHREHEHREHRRPRYQVAPADVPSE